MAYHPHLVTVGLKGVNTLFQSLCLCSTMMANMVCCFLVLLFVFSLLFFSGLIHFKIVIHCFIDGYSRYVLAIKASNNNRAATVLDLFINGVVDKHGLPSRVRGDHGTENLQVAQYMENTRGSGRGSYLWGRNVLVFINQSKY